ncbi:hypothetical protein F0L74_06015 [Chitinophaga agrisoli]|uniref:Uncharacterized protein n=1 Tax=Chitinophaga agrisoli TaxID=2607653 RepID=A0A5B2W496_9BACT|nr:hypothetical protein [Chitinophaga agrisoli]KAA2245512.1 hypothetical protein F0L74_06015 [Chitinophaga agrisoli]
MNRNTKTTLSELRIGDRFHFLKDFAVWQIIEKTRTHVAVNQPKPGTEIAAFIHRHHELKKGKTEVIFMRHTELQPGERGLFQDLKPGNVFGLPNDFIKEYVVTEDGKHAVGINTLDESGVRNIHATDAVVFIRSNEIL